MQIKRGRVGKSSIKPFLLVLETRLMPVLKAERPLFNIVQAVLVLLLKGHGVGVTVEKSMHTDFFFFFFAI